MGITENETAHTCNGHDGKEGAMESKRYSLDQVLEVLQEAQSRLTGGSDLTQVCRELGISEQTYYRWRKLYGGVSAREALQLQKMMRENASLRRVVAEQAVNLDILKDIASKKW
jgi:putative transposase